MVPIREQFTTTEAATVLGLSRPTLLKLVDFGEIDLAKVGTHHRIPGEPILAFQRARKARRAKAAEALAEFCSNIGLVD